MLPTTIRTGREGAPRRAPFAAHDVLGYLLDHRGELSRAHGRIADAILHHPTTFVEKPIEDLVTWLGISAPTITRFSRVIGCEGLRDPKLKIMGSMRVVRRAEHAIVQAYRTLDPAQLEQAVDRLVRARRIFAFGSGGVSSWLVDEVHNRLFRLGLTVTTSADHQMQMMTAATVEKGDIVFCSSLSGNNAELIRAARIAADYGATTVALTVADTPLAAAVDLPLTVRVADERDVNGPTPLRYAFMAVIDMLAYGAAMRGGSQAQEKLRRIKQQFTTFRDADDSQPVSD